MSSGNSLHQFNLGVQGGTQGSSHKSNDEEYNSKYDSSTEFYPGILIEGEIIVFDKIATSYSKLENHITSSSCRKISQQLPELESLGEKKGVVSYKALLTINGNKYSDFQEDAGLSNSEDFINEVLDDAT
ncbi:hypothetical protein TNCV_3171091 [Trichonephila clavipes]|nr:hypothetical protein TNCV_3171091 [Trichonephila clavipes]